MSPSASFSPHAKYVSKGLFIDRWGTLLERPRKGFVSRYDRARFTPGALDAMFHASQTGWNLYLIGNESSVAQGHISGAQWESFESALVSDLHKQGIPITRSYACLDDPDGVAPHNNESVFQFPKTGVFHHAAQVDGIDLKQSWVIGDSTLELVAGWRANCRTAGVLTGEGLADGAFPVEPNYQADCLADVLGSLDARTVSRAC